MHPHGELIQRGFEAFAAGDLAAISDLLADDIAWHTTGESVLSGDFVGKDAVFGYFAKLIEVTEGTFHQEIHAILADDEHVVVVTDVSWEKPRPFVGNDVFVWHVKDGKATECWAVQKDQAASAAALA